LQQKRKLKKIEKEKFVDTVVLLCKEANYNLPLSIVKALIRARENETDERPREVLSILIENARIAHDKKIPICQDTGVVSVFLEIGRELIIDFDIYSAVQEGVKKGYKEGCLRASIVFSPFNRTNTGDNTPAIVYTEFVNEDNIKILLIAKGAGSENQGGVFMLKPHEQEKIPDIVVDYIKDKAPYACPPIIVGIGIGGDMERSCFLSKKALTREFLNPDKEIAELENSLLSRINRLGIGPGGLSGKTTALAVRIETHPCHIGSLPMAINIGCYATRYKKAIL